MHSRTPHLVLIIALIVTICVPQGVFSILCYCNVCGKDTDSCNITDHKDSQCYKSVIRHRGLDGNLQEKEKTYGCFSVDPDRDSLNFMQCRAALLNHENPTFIKCCNDQDYCNDDNNIEDPIGGRWDEDTYDSRIKLLALLFFIIFLIVTIIVLIKLAQLVVRYQDTTKELQGSTGSLFKIPDLESVFVPHLANGSLSTQTYLSSVGSFPKHTLDESSLPDATIGSGRLDPNIDVRRLNERTIAKAVSKNVCYVGEGRFGKVIRGVYHGEDVAVKCFSSIDEVAWSREDLILRTWISHDNVVRFITSESFTDPNTDKHEHWMFLQYCEYGSLSDYLDNNEIMGQQQAVKILFSIINGLNYLHENHSTNFSPHYKPSIAHRDLKSKNILMKTPDVCCLADFGHALFRVDEHKLDFGAYGPLHVGTVRYMAPEILERNDKLDYGDFSTYAKADLYQFGLTLWEVCNRTSIDVLHPANQHLLPYHGVVPQDPSIDDMTKIVCEDNYRPRRNNIWDEYPIMREVSALMPECWRKNPTARMETLGVKKRLKELFELVNENSQAPTNHSFSNTFSLSPSYRSDRTRSDKSKSDFTM